MRRILLPDVPDPNFQRNTWNMHPALIVRTCHASLKRHQRSSQTVFSVFFISIPTSLFTRLKNSFRSTPYSIGVGGGVGLTISLTVFLMKLIPANRLSLRKGINTHSVRKSVPQPPKQGLKQKEKPLTVRVCEPQAKTGSYSTVSSKSHQLLGEDHLPAGEKTCD